MAVKNVNYTEDMVATMLDMWNTPQEGETQDERLVRIADAIGRTTRSVRAKLVRENAYKAAPAKTAAKREDSGPSKKELMAQLRDVAPFDVDGFEPCTKATIAAVLDFIVSTMPEPEQENDTQD